VRVPSVYLKSCHSVCKATYLSMYSGSSYLSSSLKLDCSSLMSWCVSGCPLNVKRSKSGHLLSCPPLWQHWALQVTDVEQWVHVRSWAVSLMSEVEQWVWSWAESACLKGLQVTEVEHWVHDCVCGRFVCACLCVCVCVCVCVCARKVCVCMFVYQFLSNMRHEEVEQWVHVFVCKEMAVIKGACFHLLFSCNECTKL